MEEQTQLIPLKDATKAVEDMTRRVALLYIAFARTLIDELGEEKGQEIIRKAVWEYGRRIGEATRKRVEAKGLEPLPENFNTGSDLSPIGFQTTNVRIGGEVRSRIFNCALAQVWKEYGEEKLGNLYCQVDPAKMQSYHPNATIVHTRNVLWGDDLCEMATRNIDQ